MEFWFGVCIGGLAVLLIEIAAIVIIYLKKQKERKF